MKKGNAWTLALVLAVMLPAMAFAQDETSTRMARVPAVTPTDIGGHGNLGTPPAAPTPVGPPSGSKGNNVAPILAVSHASAVVYEFAVYTEESNVPIVGVACVQPTWAASGPSHGLPYGTYSWTCRVFDGTAWSPYFEPRWSFTVYKDEPPLDAPPAPIPVEPPSGIKAPRLLPELVVMPPMGITSLHYRVMRGDANEIVAEGFTAEARWRVAALVPELSPDVYSWSCRAFDGEEWGNWFEPWWTFEVEKAAQVTGDGVAGGRTVRPAEDTNFAPNPYDTRTRLRFNVARPGNLSVAVYSTEGRLVRTLANSPVAAGPCALTWDGRDDFGNSVGAGTYLCRICTDDFTSTVKVTKTR
ncbi:hypothetical protein FJY71_01360 [candidate division WOR-3 bacterium]|nr:hypothetical protein [candidate division WOR-3 bacterium]